MKLQEVTDCKYLDVYTISSKVMAKDNFLISLIDNNVLKLEYLTKLMEWNIRFCIINSVFDNNNNIIFDPTKPAPPVIMIIFFFIF